MDGEEKNGGVRKRCKQVKINLESDDDEPIGSLFKLKSKRNAKKVRVGIDSEKGTKVEVVTEKPLVADEEMGGMEDTLASFRKKLKGPKKDSGSGSLVKKQMLLNLAEASDGCPKEPLTDEGFITDSVQEDEVEIIHVTSDANISQIPQNNRAEKVKLPKKFVLNSDVVKIPDGNTSGNQMESQDGSLHLQRKRKKKAGKSKSALSGNNLRASLESDNSEIRDEPASGGQLLGKDGPASPSDEILADSLSSLFRKAQKGQSGMHKKLRASSGSNSKRGVQVSDYDCCPSSDGVSLEFQPMPVRNSNPDARLVSDSQNSEDYRSANCQISSSSVRVKDTVIVNSMITDENMRSGDDKFDDTARPVSGVPIIQESDSISALCSEKILELKSSEVCGEADVMQERPLLVPSDKSLDEDALQAPSTELDKQCASSSENSMNASSRVHVVPLSTSASEIMREPSKPDKDECHNKCDDVGGEHAMDVSRVDLLCADQNRGDDATVATDFNEGANEISSPMITPNENGACQDDASKCNSLVVNERAVRKAKKRKDGDMAYEGDAAWELLVHEHYGVDRDQGTRTKERLHSSSAADPDLESGGVAAVSVGLKARAVGPVEKIKFREVLKRKGGLQEYLDCRNKILGLWNKDVTRILPLTDCGIAASPTENEPARASLMREIYSFLDHSGYINNGIAAVKEKSEPSFRGNYTLLGEKKFEGNSGASVADSADGVSFILGQVKNADTGLKTKDDVALDNGYQSKEAVKSGANRDDASLNKLLNGCERVEELDEQRDDVKMSEGIAEPDCAAADLLGKSHGNGAVSNQSILHGQLDISDFKHSNSENQKRIIVVGAGPAGLTAARHLQRQGFSVIVLEARSRIGGRVYTDRSSLSVPVDLGASIITGVEADVAGERRPDPSSLVCAQLGLELTVLNSDCPLYDTVTGHKVPADIDEALEAEFNSLLDDMVLIVAQKGDSAAKMSLEDGLEYGLKRRHKVHKAVTRADNGGSEMLKPLINACNHSNDTDECHPKDKTDVKEETLSPLERRVMNWHFAHLEYGCAALLKDVSLPHWNQDDVYGGFGGAHCMIKGGYGAVVESIAQGLSIHMNQVVVDISYSGMEPAKPGNCHKVKVSTSNGNDFFGDAVLITVPLGCLKAESIKFSPPLPEWKHASIQRLGFGVLNKVVLEFPEVFWDDTVDYFGATAEHTDSRGRCFMFWNVKKTVGAPILIALVVGKAAVEGQDDSPSNHVSHALTVLRKLFGDAAVPDPVASVVTDWGRDPFSYGAYSYVAVGASGEDYDILGRPVENCLFFAGEATCKEHPDTVGGAMMSGLREAVRIIDILTTGNDYTAEAEAVEAAQRQSNNERNEVKDIIRRLDKVYLSDVFYKSPSDRSQTVTRDSLLRDMFFNAKTFAGRLRLAKELLSLPVESLKSFAGTKEGLSVLNSWILDSLGKDGTQLLRHCVRILVLVSTDLVAVRLSGIGKTVKEKVCVHTSRDIRGIASQLVNLWIEVFRKEKASNGGLKLLRHMTNAESSKAKVKDHGSRKPPIRVQHCATGSKTIISSKKLGGKQVKLENVSGSKTDNKVEAENIPLSEEERAAVAAAEAAHAAALAAAEAYASSEARYSMMQLPKIPSFQKFARQEQYAHMDDSERKKWSGGVLGRQDCISEIDSRNCRVRDWSVDFSATCANLDSSKLSADNLSPGSHSNDMPQLNWREHSGESAAGESSAFTKAWVDSSGSVGVKDYHAIERWQCQAAAAEYEFQSSMHVQDEEDSSTMSRFLTRKHEGVVNESSVSQVTVNKDLAINQRRGAEHIKQGVVDYVASLLMPLYKARKIDKDGYKSIMKKSATKVMEQTTDAEKAMTVFEFLDFKRKNKIRAFVDKLIERHMSMKPVVKP